uniref:Uncharacterized protein n=1 Tax=Odontella aurita TaxID=265563 RepID=A0A7S4K4F7_9STRA|mmetsp:Transcript_60670/g.179926  ORF Transcript_60670/g.179926 Transcript_60670/m.179926 type:complete len:240 (+) Transcript_60670:193-912(+)
MTKQVNFEECVLLYRIPPHTEFSEDERVALWFSPRELGGIRANVRRTVKSMRRREQKSASGDNGNNEFCDRGLEHLRSSEHVEQHKINRDCCLAAVLDEQSRQLAMGRCDNETLANASTQGSQWARHKARVEGLRDASIVLQIRQEHVIRCQPDGAGTGILELAMRVLCDASRPVAENESYQSVSQSPILNEGETKSFEMSHKPAKVRRFERSIISYQKDTKRPLVVHTAERTRHNIIT